MVPPNQRPPPPMLFSNPFITMQQPPLSSLSSHAGPVYQGMAPSSQQAQQRHHLPLSRRHKKKFRKAGPQHLNHKKHESSGVVSYDRSAGVNRGMTRNDAGNNPGGGKV